MNKKEDKSEGIGSSEEDQDNSGGETGLPEIDPRVEARAVEEKEEREAAQRGSTKTPQLVGATLQVAISIGVREVGIGRIIWFRPETDKQLVHKPKKTALEAFGGYAIYGDGWPASTQCSSSVHGGSLYGRRYIQIGAVILK